MKNKITYVNGMPVEIPDMDTETEKKRQTLIDLARREYEDTGALTSEKLQEANRKFVQSTEDKTPEGSLPYGEDEQ